ncbi:MAG: guanylate kinase [Synergistaceae bacterium]|nr:guanylate kinase [Synergistaceae bacterium]MBQ7169727.1 guanylate kinase [Synergistaceae bacterium]
MKTGKLYVLSGPSGVGKGTLREHALKDAPNLRYSISCTTRKPREGETDGVEYRFISREKFTEDIAQGLFLEYAHVHEDYYGTLKADVMNELESGHDVLLEIDVQGALQVKEKMPGAVMIFVAPPSIDVLEHRLRGRGTEAAGSLSVRLSNAMKELALKDEYDYVIVNDDLDAACDELRKIVL